MNLLVTDTMSRVFLVEFLPHPFSNSVPARHDTKKSGAKVKEEKRWRGKKKSRSADLFPPPLLLQVFTPYLRENKKSLTPVRTPPHSPSMLSPLFIHTGFLKVVTSALGGDAGKLAQRYRWYEGRRGV